MAYRRPRSAMDNVMNIVMSISAWTLWYTMYVKHAIAVNSNAPRAALNGKMGMSKPVYKTQRQSTCPYGMK